MSAHEEWCNGEHGDSGTCQAGPIKQPVRRARLLGSEGRGFGQQTGGTAATDRDEAIRLLYMMCQVPFKDEKATRCLTPTDREFLDELYDRYASLGARDFGTITGRQLFWLRGIKDKLVEAGVL